MPKQSETNAPENRRETAESSAQVLQEPAIRHVGRTLESDPEYNDQPARELAPAAGLISSAGNDVTASPDMRDTTQRLTDQMDGGPEPLKTRLPGDTSSDPHTDVGPDNATTVQHRGEERATKRS